jgi:NADH:ubiquinone oxidoreductase subunit E
MMVMARSTQRHVALAIAAVAGIVVFACIVILVADMIAARRQDPLDDKRLEELVELVKTDAAAAGELDAESQRQANESVQRELENTRVAWTLILAAALFLAAAKWLVSLRAHRPPTLDTIVALRAPRAAQAARRAGDVRRQPVAAARAGKPGEQINLSFVDAIVAKQGRDHEAAVPILQAIQAHYGYLPDEALQRVCALTEIEPSQIAGVSAFYARFRRSPVGEHVVKVCHGTACHVTGARQITEEIRRHLKIAPEEDTDPERLFTVDRVACLGCCSLAPVMMIDDETVGRLTPSSACAALDALRPEQPA